jgi:hypothetical protein
MILNKNFISKIKKSIFSKKVSAKIYIPLHTVSVLVFARGPKINKLLRWSVPSLNKFKLLNSFLTLLKSLGSSAILARGNS